ncbi:hypothetical protein [Vallitalea guaymasensis]|uniref:hypothetical protein n=1 Tax=Vallitalea guaymasensis TaxID=1185412 RepID=UPI00272C1293|nr:hypothetical protein [Vallitalea guaymasensis]
MYEELDKYLSGFFTDDYWYDEGFEIAAEIIQDFNKEDWDNLLSYLPSKSIEWQIRYAYCVDSDINDENIIKSLILLCNIDNDELFEKCIDSLRVIVNEDNIKMLSNDKTLIDKVEKIIPKCGVATKKIFEDFITKINC